MTKKIRVENADTSTYKVVVQVWEKGKVIISNKEDGVDTIEPDLMITETPLNNPADLTEFMIWGGRYLVVKEA